MLGRSLQHGADESPGGTKSDGTAAPEAVSEEAYDGKGCDGAEGLDGVEKAEDWSAGIGEF